MMAYFRFLFPILIEAVGCHEEKSIRCGINGILSGDGYNTTENE